MGKFFGIIGFAENKEGPQGVWKEEITERSFYGDVIRNTRRLQNPGKVNDDITLNNEFSIIADPFTHDNIYNMRYIEYMGVKWRIDSVDASTPPRVILSVGGVYNVQ